MPSCPGCPQVDEPALREGLPLKRARWESYLSWAVRAFRLSTVVADPSTQVVTHLCYSEFADILPVRPPPSLRLSRRADSAASCKVPALAYLAVDRSVLCPEEGGLCSGQWPSRGGELTHRLQTSNRVHISGMGLLQAIDGLDADVLTIENSRSGDEMLRALAKYGYSRDIGAGVYDVHSPVVPPVDFIEKKIKTFLDVGLLGGNKNLLWVNPDCGLKTREWSQVRIPSPYTDIFYSISKGCSWSAGLV